MREILFRGKRTENGVWVEGNFFESTMSGCYILQAKIKARANRQMGYTVFGDEAIPFEVDSSTVGQYTGLTDKNGKRIFEGDICEAYGYVAGSLHGAIIWRNEAWCVFDERFGAVRTAHFNAFDIIGNIYDNLELV